MRKSTKIAISVGVVGVTGLSIFTILKRRRLARQAFDAEIVENDEINDVDDEVFPNLFSNFTINAEEEQDDTDDELPDDDFDSDEADALAEEDVEISPDEEQEDDDTDIYPPIDECPYKSRDVWADRINECIRPIFKSIMEAQATINWEKIENELVDKYLELSQDEFGVTGYEERYIRTKIMKINREHYERIIDIIDSAIDDIFNTNIDNKYIIDGHVNNKMICNDIMLKCCEEGVVREWQWPSVCAHLENNVNTTCEYINAVIAKNNINN